jgi:hypothetical protein
MADGVEPGTVGDQMSRMFFGGFGRKKKGEKDQRS